MKLQTESNQTIEILTIGDLFAIYIQTQTTNLVRENLNSLDVIDFITNIESDYPELKLNEAELEELNLFGLLLDEDSLEEWKNNPR